MSKAKRIRRTYAEQTGQIRDITTKLAAYRLIERLLKDEVMDGLSEKRKSLHLGAVLGHHAVWEYLQDFLSHYVKGTDLGDDESFCDAPYNFTLKDLMDMGWTKEEAEAIKDGTFED